MLMALNFTVMITEIKGKFHIACRKLLNAVFYVLFIFSGVEYGSACVHIHMHGTRINFELS